MTDLITLEAIKSRHAELAGLVPHTPTVRLCSDAVAKALNSDDIFLKLESLQRTSTFKARGALSNISVMDKAARARGITAASAGNHAIAAAWAAKVAGVSAKVVMQDTANPYRIALAQAQGAQVILKPPGAATFAEAERLVAEEGRTFLHPFEGLNTSLGTAGVGLEFIKDVPDLDAVVIACGGGGLLSGVAAAVKLSNPACKVYGVEPKGADSMSRSLKAGKPVTLQATDTLADSLAPPMALPFGFALCQQFVDDIVTVTDDQICAGQVILQQEAKQAVEPAAGAAMAGALGPLRARLSGRRIGVLVCGANIDAASYAAQLQRGLPHVASLLA